VQKSERAKILPFAKSGKSFAIRGVWIQMAKVLAKAHLNLFSPFCHSVFGSKWKKRANFLLFSFAICFCYFLFLIGCLGPNGKKKSKFFAICPFAIQTGPEVSHVASLLNISRSGYQYYWSSAICLQA
jgi:hypothetical protein